MENSESHPVAVLFVLGMIIWCFVTAYQLGRQSARKTLFRQAAKQGVVLLRVKHLPLGGPYWWRRGRGQSVFAVRQRLHNGEYRDGYAVCGSAFVGTWIEVVHFDF